MSRPRFPLIVGLGLIFIAPPAAAAQSPAAGPKAPPGSAAGAGHSDAKAEAERVRKGHQSQARSLLFSLGGDARAFRNQTLRTRSLARVADALWGVEAEQGRAFFREAWEAAEAADRESQQRLDLRGEVLKLAAARDRLLAEEFLQKLKADRQDGSAEPAGSNSPSGSNLWTLPEALEKRLELAENLLGAGDVGGALQFADPVLGGVTISTVDFLTHLRGKDPAAADRRYAALVAGAGGNTRADANLISVLSSYIFTPHNYVLFNAQGSADAISTASSYPPAGVDPRLRLAFFQTAAGVLLRPQPPAGQDHSPAGVVGKYMVVKRLLPLFEQHAPKEMAAAMRGQLEVLASLVSEGVRQNENEWVQKGIGPEKQLLASQEQSLLDQIERAGTADERDELYFQLALHALGKDDPRARDHAGKIEESWFRKRAEAWVDASLAISAIKKKKTETALELARGGELTHIQRVWVLTQSAKLLAKTDRDRALSLLDEATAEARRIEGTDPDRPRGLLAVANALELIDPPRAWAAALEAIKAANSTEGFTGEGGALTLRVNSKSRISRTTEPVPDFDLEGIFGKLARGDYERAAQLARGLEGEAPRVNATIAIARAVLNEKRPAALASQSATKD